MDDREEIKDVTRQVAERFQCSYKVFSKGSDSKLVEEAYFEALKRGQAGGFYPAVVCLDDYALEWLLEINVDADKDRILSEWEDRGEEILKERYEEYTEYLGNKVVCHNIPIRPGRNLAVICEAAAVNHRQKKMGYNAAQELYRRVQANLAKPEDEE